MERVTDYLLLWKQIVENYSSGEIRKADRGRATDAWAEKARWLDECIKKRWKRSPDSSRRFVTGQLQNCPNSTVLDIGAGTGAWTCLLAAHAKKVTAVEPSPFMRRVLRENMDQKNIRNVEIIPEPWPQAQVERHDFSICSHAMYGYPDFKAFIQNMEKATLRTCFLLLRAPVHGGLMGEASKKIWGQPYDSTNFQIAYNALLQMGIFAHVLMEDTGMWEPWTHISLEEAVRDVKRRFGLGEASEHEDYLYKLLKEHLVWEGGRYVWPRGVCSALVYWNAQRPAKASKSDLPGEKGYGS